MRVSVRVRVRVNRKPNPNPNPKPNPNPNPNPHQVLGCLTLVVRHLNTHEAARLEGDNQPAHLGAPTHHGSLHALLQKVRLGVRLRLRLGLRLRLQPR